MGEIHDDEPLVCIATFPSEQEAEMARMLLETNGMDAFIATDDCGSWEPWLQNSLGVRVLVGRADAGFANELLNAVKNRNG